MSDSFWAGGRAAYKKGIRKEFKPILKELKTQLKLAQTEPDRRTIEAEIARVGDELKSKLKDADDAIF